MIEDTGLDTLHKMFICNLTHQVLTKRLLQIQWTNVHTETRYSNGYQNGSQLCNNFHALPGIKHAKQVNTETQNMAQIYR